MQKQGITKRGKGWQIKFDAATKDGKRQQRYVTFHGTFKEAQVERTRLLAARDGGTLPDRTKLTVADHVGAWLAGSDRSTKSVERWQQLARLQINPHLGAVPLQKLTPAHVRAWHKAMLDAGLSGQTAKLAHQLLRMTLATAVVDGFLTRNPTDHTKPPKREASEVEIVAPEAIGPMLDALKGHALHPIASLALATGARRSELLALQWGDVSLDAKPPTVKIQRSIEETKTHGLRLKSPKTKAGTRTITLPPPTVSLLRAHKVAAMEYRLALGAGKLGDSDLVFCDANLQMLSPTGISTQWHRAVRRIDMPPVTFHALRHTHASLLIAKKVDILTISRRLGHAKASMTLDTYAHLMEGADEEAANAIAGVL